MINISIALKQIRRAKEDCLGKIKQIEKELAEESLTQNDVYVHKTLQKEHHTLEGKLSGIREVESIIKKTL